ncbi:IclR family transcriptional regulator [Micromonospora sp. NPDC050686]|uniref:IclR family transcriptional regulator n=1 Tax=Micromonospora sp. NPDC050686 TaxID=3154631 RepID=UPI00340358C5
MGSAEPKTPPAYVVTSADHALRIAVMLQLEGGLTVSQVAERLDVARSTAHRLLQTLVYRDFAVQDDQRVYHPGPVLELAAHSQSRTSQLRAAALPHLQRLVDLVGESANLAIRTGDTTRFIASVECRQALRVGSREGMVFPAHRTTAGLVLLAEVQSGEVDDLYAAERYAQRPDERPDMSALRGRLTRVRRAGFALNNGMSERGVVAIGVPVRDADGTALAGLSISMPAVRYDRHQLPALVATLHRAAGAIEAGGH